MLSYRPIFFYTSRESYRKHVETFPYVEYLFGNDLLERPQNQKLSFILRNIKIVLEFSTNSSSNYNQQKEIGTKICTLAIPN